MSQNSGVNSGVSFTPFPKRAQFKKSTMFRALCNNEYNIAKVDTQFVRELLIMVFTRNQIHMEFVVVVAIWNVVGYETFSTILVGLPGKVSLCTPCVEIY